MKKPLSATLTFCICFSLTINQLGYKNNFGAKIGFQLPAINNFACLKGKPAKKTIRAETISLVGPSKDAKSCHQQFASIHGKMNCTAKSVERKKTIQREL